MIKGKHRKKNFLKLKEYDCTNKSSESLFPGSKVKKNKLKQDKQIQGVPANTSTFTE